MKPGILALGAAFALAFVPGRASGNPDRDQALAAMKKAARFMMEEASVRGGFVWRYSAGLSERWGEIPARPTQVWVQPPGTTSMGSLMLDAFRATGDRDYLAWAERVADALVSGQHPLGGWHYFIDFDPPGIAAYYRDTASKCWGWEEYYHYYGNCTFDDDVHTSATRFLMDLSLATLDPKLRPALDKALDFVLASQFPNGAWPQRFPLHEDYTAFYTFNDGVTPGNVALLLHVAEKLGRPDYERAARRGMNFVIQSQLPPPQAGWALQYDHEMRPAKARNYEPAAVSSAQTVDCIKLLQEYYRLTGDRKFLRGIPDALRWLEASDISRDPAVVRDGRGFTHASFYEVGTNKPLYAHRRASLAELDSRDPDHGYWVDYEFGNFTEHYGEATRIDLAALKKEYARTEALTSEQALVEGRAAATAGPPPARVTPVEAREIMAALDTRGAWLEDLTIAHYPDFRDRAKARQIKGFTTRTFEANMRRLMAFAAPKPERETGPGG